MQYLELNIVFLIFFLQKKNTRKFWKNSEKYINECTTYVTRLGS